MIQTGNVGVDPGQVVVVARNDWAKTKDISFSYSGAHINVSGFSNSGKMSNEYDEGANE